MRNFILLLLLCFVSGLGAQTFPTRLLPKKVRTQLRDYALIPGGRYVKNLYFGSDSLQFQFPKRVSVDSFYMSRYEVTVEDFVRFYHETGDLEHKYDSAVWMRDFPYSFNKPITQNYFHLSKFRNFPVVGITWDQALRFCAWKSKELNALLENTGYAVEVTLPTDVEWQYAAYRPVPQQGDSIVDAHQFFPWGYSFFCPRGKQDACRLRCNSGRTVVPQGFTLIDDASDGGLYTMPVKSFEPNGYGLYQMSGNVAEWTLDNFSVDYAIAENAKLKFPDNPEMAKKYTPVFAAGTYDDYKIVKGGSWADQPFYMQIGVVKIQHPEKASSTIGFRPVLRVYRK